MQKKDKIKMKSKINKTIMHIKYLKEHINVNVLFFNLIFKVNIKIVL